MKKVLLIAAAMILPLFFSGAFAHQVDSVGDYRIEMDWKHKPIVTGESNAIVVYVSEMDKSKEATDQKFNSEKGIEGLRKTLKIQLVVGEDEQSVTLPLFTTKTVGMYESPIIPTFSGWSQLNFFGTINETKINLALHPLKVEEPNTLKFPLTESEVVVSNDFEQEINDLRNDITELQNTINDLEEQKGGVFMPIIGLSIALGITGIAIGVASFTRKK